MASDKGWNDPPVISYSVASSTRTKKSNLTKRVVFPNSVVHDKPTLPFAVQSAPPALFPNETGNSTDKTLDVTHTDTDNCLQDDHIDEDMHKKTVDILNQCLARLTTLQKNIAADVTRRIEIFSRMWIEGKLHSDVQIKMHQCSIALWNGDYSKADSIHVTLMVDHCNQVSPWMVAIKRLIRECEKNNIQIANDDCSNLCTSESVDNKQD